MVRRFAAESVGGVWIKSATGPASPSIAAIWLLGLFGLLQEHALDGRSTASWPDNRYAGFDSTARDRMRLHGQ
jgi:hypothetical protein